jgi:hypothetical protein
VAQQEAPEPLVTRREATRAQQKAPESRVARRGAPGARQKASGPRVAWPKAPRPRQVRQMAPEPRVVQEATRGATEGVGANGVPEGHLLEKEKQKQVVEPPGQKTWTQGEDQEYVWRWRKRGSPTRETHVGR